MRDELSIIFDEFLNDNISDETDEMIICSEIKIIESDEFNLNFEKLDQDKLNYKIQKTIQKNNLILIQIEFKNKISRIGIFKQLNSSFDHLLTEIESYQLFDEFYFNTKDYYV